MTSDTKFDVLVCGSLHLDIVVKAPAIPRIDETMVGSTWSQVCGGKGGNQAVHASRSGARTAMVGRIGNDTFGDSLSVHLAKADVDQTCVTRDSVLGSGMSVAILQPNGDYGAVIISGANLAIDASTLETEIAKLGGAKILVLQNEIPEDVNLAAARAARRHGIQVLLNAAPARKLSPDLLETVDVLIVNRIEAEAFFGKAVSDRKSARGVLRAQKYFHNAIVITLGGDGLVVTGPNIATTDIAAHPVEVVSTHGAGDCFVGHLAAELAKGHTLLEACASANIHAAAFVSRVQ
jgi:ribokinase